MCVGAHYFFLLQIILLFINLIVLKHTAIVTNWCLLFASGSSLYLKAHSRSQKHLVFASLAWESQEKCFIFVRASASVKRGEPALLL